MSGINHELAGSKVFLCGANGAQEFLWDLDPCKLHTGAYMARLEFVAYHSPKVAL